MRSGVGGVSTCILACLLLTGSLAGVAIADEDARSVGSAGANASVDVDERTASTVVHANVTVNATSDRFHVELRFTGAETTRVTLSGVPGMRVARSDGFTETGDGNWKWESGTASTPPTFEYTVDTNASRRNDVGGDWAFGATDEVVLSVHAVGGSVTRPNAPNGYVTDSYFLLGDHEVAHESGADGELTVVTSAAVRSSVDAGDAATTLARVTRSLNVSERRQNTTMFVPPGSYDGPYGVATRGGSEMMVRGDAVWDGLMTHEYLHTRQYFDPDDSMRWFIEGSAFYYMALVPYQDRTMNWQRFDDRVSPVEDFRPTVTENTTYAAAARRGSTVLATLDHRIRLATNDTRTLEDVYVRLNQRDDVNYATFRAVLVDVAGPSVGEWADAHVDGDGSLPPPERGQFVPPNASLNATVDVYVCADDEWEAADDTVATDGRVYLGYDGWGTFDVAVNTTSASTERNASVDAADSTRCGEQLPSDGGQETFYAVSTDGNASIDLRLSTQYERTNRTIELLESTESTNASEAPNASESTNGSESPKRDDTDISGPETQGDSMASDPESVPGFDVVAVAVAVLVGSLLARRGRD